MSILNDRRLEYVMVPSEANYSHGRFVWGIKNKTSQRRAAMRPCGQYAANPAPEGPIRTRNTQSSQFGDNYFLQSRSENLA